MRNREAPAWRGALTVGVVVGVILALSGNAAAEGRGQNKVRKRAPSAATFRMCRQAYDSGRQLESVARLREAKEMMLTCAQPSCEAVRHGFLRHDCLFRFSRIEADIPTVIPVAVDQRGEAVNDVQVLMDGTLLTARVEGIAFSIDPGIHEFVFKKGGAVLAHRSIVVLQGQQNRALTVTLEEKDKGKDGDKDRDSDEHKEAPPAETAGPTPNVAKAAVAEPPNGAPRTPAATPAGRHLSFGSVSLGLIGLGGAGGFGLLTYWGRQDNARLSQCTPNCPQASVDRVAKLYRAANISLGVGAGALLLATWVYAVSGGGSEEAQTPRRTAALRLDVTPLAVGGAVASMSGRF